MQDEPDAQTLVMVGVQARDKPNARSAMKNDATKVAWLLLHVPVFLSLAGTQMLDKPDTWTRVTVRAQVWDELGVQ